MAKLNECETAQGYVGKAVDAEKLLLVSYKNGKSYPEGNDRYIADCYHYKKDLLDQFGITPLLLEKWGYSGIEFSVYLYVENEKLTGCKIFKYKNTHCGGHGRPSGYELIPSQQEIRIFRRIMDYITA